MPWTVGEQPRSGSGESQGPGARDSMVGTQKRGTRQGPWVRDLNPEERCVVSVGVGVHNKSLKPVSLTPPQEAGKPMGAKWPPIHPLWCKLTPHDEKPWRLGMC